MQLHLVVLVSQGGFPCAARPTRFSLFQQFTQLGSNGLQLYQIDLHLPHYLAALDSIAVSVFVDILADFDNYRN